MVRSKAGLGKWAVRAFAFVAVAEILYLLSGNLLLNAGFLPQMLSRDPERFSIEWASAWTLLPGHLRVTGLTLSGQTPEQEWWLSMGQAEARLAPGSLFFKTVRFEGVEADKVTAGARERLAGASGSAARPAPVPAAGGVATATADPQAEAAPLSVPQAEGEVSPAEGAPLAPTAPEAEQAASDWSGWSIAVGDADLAQIEALEVKGYRFSGQARLRLEDFSFRLDGPVAMARGRLQLDSGEFQRGSELLAAALQGDIDIRLDEFVPGENPGAAAARFLSGRIGLSGDLTSFAFLDAYLSDSQWLQLDGSGRLQASLHIEHGRLLDGSELSIESPDLTLVLDERLASGTGERHLLQGAGRVHADVRLGEGRGQTQLQVELRDVAMRRLPGNELFLQAEGFHLGLTAAPVDLSERPGEPAVSMQWRQAVMPDIALLNSYLPAGLPFRLVSGQARLNGQFAYAERAVSGSFELAGEKVSGIVFEKPVIGSLAVDLIIKEADVENRRLDLSGSRIRMQASENRAARGAGKASLQTELKLVQLQLQLESESELSLAELRAFSGQPPLSGEVKLEGTVANIDFLNAFLAPRHAIEFGGGRLQADLRLNKGHLASPSRVTVESDRLLSRFSGFELSGAGGVAAEILTLAGAETMRMDMGLRAMQVRQLKGGEVFLRGKGIQLIATSPLSEVRKMRVEPTAVLSWQDALMPDVALLNSYIPGKPPFSLSSGAARSSGRLKYAGRKLSGSVNLAGENVAGTLFGESVVGQLGVDLVIKQADPASGVLDLSGSSVRMQAAAAAGAAGESSNREAPLQTRITVTEARLKSRPLSAKQARSGQLSPLSGVVKLEGSVANIAFLNHFLHGDQGLAFSGDARMSADLRLAEGKVAPGTRLTAESEHLVSRFLDFEASGSGVLKAAMQGAAGAPEGKLEVALKSFGLRRLDDKTAYVSGRDFQITTVGKRFDSKEGLRELETVVTLGAAEIPDISVYNAYLPKEGGVSIGSGKASLAADFRLSGVTGSAKLEMRASGVAVHVKEQTIKGDLRISTRLTAGNLEKMSFDAAGTQLRIDNGSLESEGTAHDDSWWGQIDIERGRMTWKRPLKLDAEISLRLRDSGLLVHLFVKQTKEKPWLNDLLTIRDVSGRSEVHLNDRAIVLSNARLSGEKLLVLANLRLSEETMRGGLYASYGILGAGIELQGEERSWKLLNPRKWYDGYSAAFSAEKP